MIDLRLDLRDFERAARGMQAAVDQIPFALSQALNDAAFKVAGAQLNDAWARGVTVRDPGFFRGSLRVNKSDKRNLTVEVYDHRQRGHLREHAEGGIKRARGRLAIPSARIKATRTAKGVPTRLRPGNLKRAVVKGNLIFVPEGKGKNARLRLAYALRPQARIKKAVPLHEAWQRGMAEEVRRAFGPRLAAAMRTRR